MLLVGGLTSSRSLECRGCSDGAQQAPSEEARGCQNPRRWSGARDKNCYNRSNCSKSLPDVDPSQTRCGERRRQPIYLSLSFGLTQKHTTTASTTQLY
ncbi:hypothetical protein DPEC_G00264560 [Dallia pectoralis]|uniref:Uncharacterized protein n=1 Tax=Dallia pectoralis TaxID=75939 RepID=A0ACC2FSK7_DALPE|nr:hypothetical protein DPEC_G00264560 [Dallia pectoralis]